MTGEIAGSNWPDRLAVRPLMLFASLAVVTFLLRAPALGDWNLEIDDQWYALVGHRLLAGDLLYVDIFDRKGPALYLAFAALALFGKSAIPYQIFAGLCATWAAYLTARLAMARSNAVAGLAATLLMVALVFAYGGANAQTPIFYNPLVLLGAYALVTRIGFLRQGRIDRRLMLGFFAVGLAIAFKLSVVFEGLYFGICAALLLWRSGAPRVQVFRDIATLAMLGALPMLVAAVFYLTIGHFEEFWQAIVQSNLDRSYFTLADRLNRLSIFLTMIGLPLALFIGSVGLRMIRKEMETEDAFLAGWALVAIAAIIVFPAYYSHYALTVIAPLCIGIAPILQRSRLALVLALAFAPLAVIKSGEFAPSLRSQSREVSAELVDYVRRELRGGNLVVWGSPTYLHVLSNAPPLSVLAFPPHLYHQLEAGASGRDELTEVRQMLARGPAVIVMQDKLAKPPNTATMAAIWEYVGSCRKVRQFDTYDHLGSQVQTVYSRCGPAAKPPGT